MSNTEQMNVGIFSFFTGAGFLDLGFENAGFKSYLANEIDPNFASVYRYSRQQMKMNLPVYGLQEGDVCAYLRSRSKARDLRSKVVDAKKEMEFVGFIGGPPCPDFSVANANAQGADGLRGQLTRAYADIICQQQPDFFVLENVKGLVSTAKHREFFQSMISLFQHRGYATTYRLINALEYGVAQDRQRIILIGVKKVFCKGWYDKRNSTLVNFPWQNFIRYPMDRVSQAKWPVTDAFAEGGIRNKPDGIIDEVIAKPLGLPVVGPATRHKTNRRRA